MRIAHRPSTFEPSSKEHFKKRKRAPALIQPVIAPEVAPTCDQLAGRFPARRTGSRSRAVERRAAMHARQAPHPLPGFAARLDLPHDANIAIIIERHEMVLLTFQVGLNVADACPRDGAVWHGWKLSRWIGEFLRRKEGTVPAAKFLPGSVRTAVHQFQSASSMCS